MSPSMRTSRREESPAQAGKCAHRIAVARCFGHDGGAIAWQNHRQNPRVTLASIIRPAIWGLLKRRVACACIHRWIAMALQYISVGARNVHHRDISKISVNASHNVRVAEWPDRAITEELEHETRK